MCLLHCTVSLQSICSSVDTRSSTHKKKSASQPEIVNKRNDKISRMTREFSLVPGMSQYGDSQDVDMDVGTAVESANNKSFSTSADNFAKLPQSFDRVAESTHNHGDFSPATKEARLLSFISSFLRIPFEAMRENSIQRHPAIIWDLPQFRQNSLKTSAEDDRF